MRKVLSAWLSGLLISGSLLATDFYQYSQTMKRSGVTLANATATVTGAGGALSSIFSDAGSTPKANPTTTNSAGVLTFYAATGSYKITVGDTVWQISLPVVSAKLGSLEDACTGPNKIIEFDASGHATCITTPTGAALSAAQITAATADGSVGGAEEVPVNDAGTLKKMTVTQVRSLAAAATVLATPRAIFGSDFDGSAALTGPVVVTAGTVAANAVQIGQAGTGIYQPAANVLGLSANGIDAVRVNTIASGVNWLEVTPAAANGRVNISAAGSDTDIGIRLQPKGVGSVSVPNGTVVQPGIRFEDDGTTKTGFYAVAGGHNAIFASGSNAWIMLDGNSGHIALRAAGQVRFGSGADPTSSYDANIYRPAASTLAFGTTTGGYSTLNVGHIVASGTTSGTTKPTVGGSCGTDPLIDGKDGVIKLTTGTGAPTSCAVTFNLAWATAPVCTASASATTAALNVVTTTTTVTVSAAALTASETIHVLCMGY